MSVPVQYGIPGQSEDVNISTSSNRNTTDIPSRRVLVQADADCRIRLGDANVAATATDVKIFSGIPYVFDTGGNTRIAVISTGTGVLSITPLH